MNAKPIAAIEYHHAIREIVCAEWRKLTELYSDPPVYSAAVDWTTRGMENYISGIHDTLVVTHPQTHLNSVQELLAELRFLTEFLAEYEHEEVAP